MVAIVSSNQWRLLADALLCFHIGISAFIVLGQIAVIVGGVADIRAVRNFLFRAIHLSLILFVACETLLGRLCPLTQLEQYFRTNAGQTNYSESFTQHWLAPLLYFDAPQWAFTALHSLAALVVVGSWWLIRPVRFASKTVKHNWWCRVRVAHEA